MLLAASFSVAKQIKNHICWLFRYERSTRECGSCFTGFHWRWCGYCADTCEQAVRLRNPRLLTGLTGAITGRVWWRRRPMETYGGCVGSPGCVQCTRKTVACASSGCPINSRTWPLIWTRTICLPLVTQADCGHLNSLLVEM